ncbi:hypothetical protein H3V53_17525 [Paraburkholderia bengalensis]|uniref:DUF1843 domain-containing protein n=1 Tax=Paraburkholderia bengalensis TaxID=2747562 RepID=A0ABU8IU01_9BURK
MSEKGVMGFPREPAPARETDLYVIKLALGHADKGLREARRMMVDVAPSDDYAKAMDALEAAQRALRIFET